MSFHVEQVVRIAILVAGFLILIRVDRRIFWGVFLVGLYILMKVGA